MNAETTSAVLKNELHRMVVQTDNLNVLQRVKQIFDLLLKEEEPEDWWDSLGEKDKLLIQRGLQQLDNGKQLPNSQVRTEINKLLGKD